MKFNLNEFADRKIEEFENDTKLSIISYLDVNYVAVCKILNLGRDIGYQTLQEALVNAGYKEVTIEYLRTAIYRLRLKKMERKANGLPMNPYIKARFYE